MKSSWFAKERVASFLVPVLIAVVLLYQVLADLQIAVTHGSTLLIVGVILAIAAAAGVLAAFGPPVVRVLVLAACTLLFLDVTFHLSGVFGRLKPETRTRMSRDEQRIADVQRIKSALDQYVARYGALPAPSEYGEGTGPAGFWQGWWDLSSEDVNGDGTPFLDFLVLGGILPSVPVDPLNHAAQKGDPRGGNQYVYMLVPPGYDYAGGTCDARPNLWHYMVAVTSLQEKPDRKAGGSCSCLWRDAPDFFKNHFDYAVCGTFDATPAAQARITTLLAQHVAAARAAKEAAAAKARAAEHAAELQKFAPQDQRRVADVQRIRQALQRYLAEVGPLPVPSEYGEAESGNAGFWSRYWDLSSEDGDGDGKPFLDFLSDSGIMPSVPVDPDNQPAPDKSPVGGRQYAYFVASPGETYGGGTCAAAAKKWVYMLGITDLQSEERRPPMKIAGSGCDCLWRNAPNFFQQHFDYVVCGTFDATPASRARAAEILRQRTAATLAAKERAAGQPYVPQDRRRVADLLSIRNGLQRYLDEIGPLPSPREYGETESSKGGFFSHYWDESAQDGDHDGTLFLDFLVDSGIMPSVPLDPENRAAPDGDPRGGRQYVYAVMSPDERFEGGSCVGESRKSVYLLGITDLRSEPTRPPLNISGSGCDCLWRNQPNFFQSQFDYVVCGTFDDTPEGRARAAPILQQRTAAMQTAKEAAANAALAEKRAAELRKYAVRDQRRVSDLLEIRKALQQYIEKVGPLPAPSEYGEAESSKPGFWSHYWDVSAEDGDHDGKPFLDFLVDKGIMKSVPVDPDNQPSPDGSPTGGRQYVYFVASPDESSDGGTCAASEKEWVYLLGITDLQSEEARPPKNISGSGCECLWRDRPNFFQSHFDYVVCGTFRR